MKPAPHFARAFTLVECAVVAGILCVLALLLLPALQIVRARSQSVQCLANLRSYGTGLLTYVAENGHLPLPDENGKGPNYLAALSPVYIPKVLFCPVSRIAPPGSSYPKNYKVTYAGSASLAKRYPRLKGIPAPLSRVVLATELLGNDFFQYPLHLNKAMWGVSGGSQRGEQLRRDARIPCVYHGSAEKRGMNLFFADGSAALVRPATGDWWDAPTYGDATNGGYFYDDGQFAAMQSGKLQVQ